MAGQIKRKRKISNSSLRYTRSVNGTIAFANLFSAALNNAVRRRGCHRPSARDDTAREVMSRTNTETTTCESSY